MSGIVDRYVLELDQEDKEELFELASFHFSRKKDFLDALDMDRKVLDNHLEGDIDAIGIDAFDRLLGIVNRSAPRFQLEDPGEYEEGRINHQGEERVKLDDDFQQFLFEPYTINELEEMTGKSEQTLVKYRNNTAKTVPVDLYSQLLEETRQSFGTLLGPEGEIHFRGAHNNGFATEEDSFLTEGGPAEVRRIKQLREDLSEMKGSPSLGYLRNNLDQFEVIEDMLEDPTSNSIYPDGKSRGRFMSALAELGLMEKFGGRGSAWIPGGKDYEYRALMKEVEKYIKDTEPDPESNYGGTSDELRQLLMDAASEYDGETPTRNWIDEQDEYPRIQAFVNHFESWNSALVDAGLEPNRTEYDRDIIIDQLLEKEHELGRVPSKTDINQDPGMFYKSTITNYFDSYEDLLEEAGLYAERKIQEEGSRLPLFITSPEPEILSERPAD